MLKNKKELSGYSQITFSVNDKGETYPYDIYFDRNVRISPTINLDASSEKTFYLIHQGGGYTSNEEYATNITLEDQADVIIMTQSSTKIYKTEDGEKSTQLIDIHLGKNTIFHFLCDSIIAYEKANYLQKTNFFLEDNATLIYVDLIGPGWSPSGEHFKFKQIWTINKIFKNGKLIILDNLRINPSENNIQSIAYFNDYLYFGSLIVINNQINKQVLNKIRDMIENQQQFEAKIGMSLIAGGGFILRVFANLNEDVNKVTLFAIDYVRQELLNKTKLKIRKY